MVKAGVETAQASVNAREHAWENADEVVTLNRSNGQSSLEVASNLEPQSTPPASEPKVTIRFSGQETIPGQGKTEASAPSPPTLTSTEKVDRKTTDVNPDLKAQDQALPLVVATEAEKHQRIAEDWPKPWVTLFVTGQQHGYIEPCGCTGLENQKGGLNRRDTLMRLITDRGWEVVPLDAGNQVRRFGRQSDIKFARTTEALRAMNYGAVALGSDDLKVSSDYLLLSMLNNKAESDSPYVSANLRISELYPDAFKVITVGSRKIGVTGFLGDEFAKQVTDINDGSLSLLPTIPSLREAVAALRQMKCDYLVLLAHASIKESTEVAKSVPEFDLVVTAGGFGEPHYKPEPIPGTKSQMIQVGVKGMYVGLVGLYDDAANPIRYQRLALSSQFDDSPRMLELFKQYQRQLKDTGFARLGVRPISHRSSRNFVGSEKCGDCHSRAFEIWQKSDHALATEHLVHPPNDRGDIARHFDPECLSCHVTGWNPQEYYPYRSGFESMEVSAHLVGNGCENCHGPGSAHVEAEEGSSDAALLFELRQAMRIKLEDARNTCLECHDLDNSPTFHADGAFERYWNDIKHYGKD
jgi:hypothetical protein